MLWLNRKKTFIVLVLVTLVISSLIIIKKQSNFSADQIVQQISENIPTYAHKIDTTASGDAITIEDWPSISSPGDPNLPVREISLIVPQNADLTNTSVSLIDSNTYEVPGNFNIAAAPPIVADINGQTIEDWGAGKKIDAGRNLNTYQKDALYPDKTIELKSIGSMREFRIAKVLFYPYQYNPVTKKLLRTEGGKAVLNLTSEATEVASISLNETNQAVQDDFTETAKEIVDNPESVDTLYTEKVSKGNSLAAKAANNSIGYMIVTTKAIASQSTKLQAFIQSKENLGYAVRTITEETWGGGTGDTAAENLRRYLKANYAGIKYLLLIGNPHPQTGDVPMKMTWPRNNAKDARQYIDAPTDSYYADLTGNWDLDGDGFYGESPEDYKTGGVDFIPEIYVGRIPYYGSITELDSILAKSTKYENGGYGTDWVKKALVNMVPGDAQTLLWQLGEQITKDILIPSNYQYVRIYNDVYGINPPPDYTPNSIDNTILAWNKSTPGFHFWATHGSELSAKNVLSVYNKASLPTDKPAFVYQSSCLNGHPETTNNLGYTLLTTAAINTVSASRVGWYLRGETEFSNSDTVFGIEYQYAKNMVSKQLSAGEALYKALSSTKFLLEMNHFTNNLYGDPSLATIATPVIEHTPLPNTDITNQPYSVKVKIPSTNDVTAGYPKLFWKTSNQSNYTTVSMTKLSSDEYEGKIPAQTMGSQVNYYIEAKNSSGSTFTPPFAPTKPNTFKIEPDTISPQINVTPIANIASRQVLVSAEAVDDKSIESVKFYYSINNGSQQVATLEKKYGNRYELLLNLNAQQGDKIKYHIVATDASKNQNQARYPSVGEAEFSIIFQKTVAIYQGTQNISTWSAGNFSNQHKQLEEILKADPKARFSTNIITSLTPANLANAQILFFPDAVPSGFPSANDFLAIDNWFTPGKTLIFSDSATSLAYATGYLWGNTKKESGEYQGWSTTGSLSNDQQINNIDGITTNYKKGDLISSTNLRAQIFTSTLPKDVKILTVSKTDPANAYAVYRDVANRGRVAVLGPYNFENMIVLRDSSIPLIQDLTYSSNLDLPTPPPNPDTTPPTAPTNLVLTGKGANEISFSWTASTDNVAVAGYKIYRNGVKIGDVSVTNFTDKNLTPETPYTYQIAAYDTSNNPSANSTALTVTTDKDPTDKTPPTVPQNLKSTNVTTNSISITWDRSTDINGVTGYTVFHDTKTNQANSTKVIDNQFTLSNLQPNTSYYFNVLASDAAGNPSAKSTQLKVTTLQEIKDTTPPSIPKNLKASNITNKSVQLSWDASTDNVAVSHYKIFRKGIQVATSNTTSYTDTGLAANTDYQYRVSAVDTSNNESVDKSTAINVKTLAAGDTKPPSTPINLHASSITSTSFTLTWSASTDNVKTTGYRIFNGNSQLGTSTTNLYKATGLTAGQDYLVSVEAFDAANNPSNKSIVLKVTTTSQTTPPDQPTNQLEISSYVVDSKTNKSVTTAKLELMQNGNLLQTAIYNKNTNLFVFPQKIAKDGKAYTLKASASGYTTQYKDMKANSFNYKDGVFYTKQYIQLKSSNAVANTWNNFVGWLNH